MGTKQQQPGQLVTLDLLVDVDKLEEGAMKVLQRVRPNWQPQDVAFRNFTDGITNKLVGGYLKSDPADVVLIRVNGEGTELFLDRKAEVQTFQLLYAAKCGPPLYAVFKNGMAYGFFHGTPLDEALVRDDKVATLIAKEMANLHAIQPDERVPSHRRSAYKSKVQAFLDIVPTSFSDPHMQAKFVQCIPSKAELVRELEELVQTLEALNMPVVFSHNDLLLKNIIYNSEKASIHFIDYEYAFLNYEAYDIGNHFDEYAGVDEVNYDLYPDKAYQLTWLRRYLEFRFTLTGKSAQDVTDVDVERLYVKTNKCACAAHFFWSLWALIQAKMSSIDFDFLDYAVTRLDEYFRRKKEFFPLTLP